MATEDIVNDVEIFVPGRLCILGEHSDWAAEFRTDNPSISYGMTIVCASNEGLFARCREGSPGRIIFDFVKSDSGDVDTFESVLDFNVLTETALKGGFFSYIAGTAAVMTQKYKINECHGNEVHKNTESNAERPIDSENLSVGSDTKDIRFQSGIHIVNYKNDLPMGKGLSSSAAVCVLVAKCFDESKRWVLQTLQELTVYSLGMTQEDLMDAAYRGEMLTPSRCGRMDQCVAMGSGSVAVMEFDRGSCGMRTISCKETLHFVVADLKAAKDTIKILQDLQECFPFPLNSTQSRLHRYTSNNQKLCWSAIAAIETGNVTALAFVMTDAQTAFDNCALPNCPTQLTAPRLRVIMADPHLRKVSLAIKGVGSQGDGTVQILCRSAADQLEALRILNDCLGCEAFLLTVPQSPPTLYRPILHPHRVRCALIISDPYAAARYSLLGSLTPPCLLPLPWLHGCSAVLLSLLQELIACGIQRIAVVVPAPYTPSLSMARFQNQIQGPLSAGPLLSKSMMGMSANFNNNSSGSVLPSKPILRTESDIGQRPEGTLGRQNSMSGVGTFTPTHTTTAWQYLTALQPPVEYMDREMSDDEDDDDEEEEEEEEEGEEAGLSKEKKGEKGRGATLDTITGTRTTLKSISPTSTELSPTSTSSIVSIAPVVSSSGIMGSGSASGASSDEKARRSSTASMFKNLSFRNVGNAIGSTLGVKNSTIYADSEDGTAVPVSDNLGGKVLGSTGDDAGHRRETTKQMNAQIPDFGSSSSPASNQWSHGKEQFELIRGRVRFFFEDENYTEKEATFCAVNTLYSVAQKLSVLSPVCLTRASTPSSSAAEEKVKKESEVKDIKGEERDGDGDHVEADKKEGKDKEDDDDKQSSEVAGRLLVIRAESLPKPTLSTQTMTEHRNIVGHSLRQINGGLYQFLSAAADSGALHGGDVPFLSLEVSSKQGARLDEEKKVSLRDEKEIGHSDSELGDDGDDDRTPHNPHHSAHDSVLQLQLDANIEVEVEVAGKKRLQYASGNGFLGTISLIPQNVEDSSVGDTSDPDRSAANHGTDTKVTALPAYIVQSEVVFGLTNITNISTTNILQVGEKEEKSKYNGNKNENSPISSFSFGGIGLLSYSDIIELLSDENIRKKFKPERLHPVDSLIQSLLHRKEIFRSLTRKNEKIRKENEDAGREKAIKDMARDKRKERKETSEDEKKIENLPQCDDTNRKRIGKFSTDVIAFGVILNGTLSVLDEKSYRRASAAALA